MQPTNKERTFLVRHYPKETPVSQRINPSEPAEPVVSHMTIRQWHTHRPGSDISTYLISEDRTADYDDAMDLAQSIADVAGYEWDARDDIKPDAIEWLLETAAHLRLKTDSDRRGFLTVPNLAKTLRKHGLSISDVASHYLA